MCSVANLALSTRLSILQRFQEPPASYKSQNNCYFPSGGLYFGLNGRLQAFPSGNASHDFHRTNFVVPVYPDYPEVVKRKSKDECQVLQACAMEEIYDTLARRLLAAAANIDPCHKFIVGIAGPPGSGKSTLAEEVIARLNAMWIEKQATSGHDNFNETSVVRDFAVSIPMDGFHLYRWQLDAMEDSAEAHARRGAPWTFDPINLAKYLSTLRSKGSIKWPSFDHGRGDPIEEDIHVTEMHKVVLVEGNYLLLSEGSWKDLGYHFDERWFIDVDLDEAMRRIENRHLALGKSPEDAKRRVEYNDRPNGQLILASKCNADLVIESVDFRKSSNSQQQSL